MIAMKKLNTRYLTPGPALQDARILFVFGSARGGTTFLNNLLDRYFDYGMGPEGTFVDKFALKMARYGDLDNDANLQRLIQDIAHCEMLEIARHRYKKTALDVTPAIIRDNLRERSYPGVVYAVFESVAKIQGRSRVGNKNPGFWRYHELLQHMFPTQAKYLAIIRDGRDIALSNQKMQWAASSIYACAKIWESMLRAIDQLRIDVRSDRLLVIRYEDILAKPEPVIEQLRQFAAPQMPPQQVDNAVRFVLEEGLRDNHGKWRTGMNDAELRSYEAIAGQWLERYGYERAVPNAQVYPLERAWYESREFARLIWLNVVR